MADCPDTIGCISYGETGHMRRRRNCVNGGRSHTNKDGDTKEMYLPEAEIDAEDLFGQGIDSGINFAKHDDIPVKLTGKNKPSAIKNFAAAGLRPILINNIKKWVANPVQKNAIPIIMAGRDLMSCAQTGAGRTVAFLLPIINKLIETNGEARIGETSQAPQCVVMTPTKKLAIQIHKEASKLAQGSKVKSVVVHMHLGYGGTSGGYQESQLQKGCNILVATPGRLLDLVEKGRVSLANCKYLVLDEADQLLDVGFLSEIKKILADPAMPKKAPEGDRQTLVFSATFPNEIQESAQEFLNDYLFLAIGQVRKAEIEVKKHKMSDLNENMKVKLNSKKVKELEESVLKKTMKAQELKVKKSLDTLKARDLKMSMKAKNLLKTLKINKLMKENVKVQKLVIKKPRDREVGMKEKMDHVHEVKGASPEEEGSRAGIQQPSSTELSHSLMELGWRQHWSKGGSKSKTMSKSRPYFFNLRTGQTLWSLIEVKAVTSCPAPQGEYSGVWC